MKNLVTKFCVNLALILVLYLSLPPIIYAAVSGKIQGNVVDAESKEPLPGVNIVVEGTALGAATDENGFFFIINVPPGTYNLKASIVGYATETKENVRVYVDRTVTTDFSLKTQAIAGEEVTVTAERVPVPLDVSATEAYISGEDISESATGRFDEMIGIQAGVEFSSSAQWGEGFSIRGGDVSETDIQLDGMSLQNEHSRLPTLALSRNLIQDVQILTGGFNAEYGNVRSGLINVVTKDGSYNRYSGVFEGTYSPKGFKHYGDFGPFSHDADMRRYGYGAHRPVLGGSSWSDVGLTNVSSEALDGWGDERMYRHGKFLLAAETMDANGNLIYDPVKAKEYIDSHPESYIFTGWTKLADKSGYTPATALDIYRWVHRPVEYGNNPDLHLDVGVGGPVPFLPKTKFYTSHIWRKSYFSIPQSRDFSTEMTNMGKLTARIKPNMTLVGNFVYSSVVGIGWDDHGNDPSFGYLSGDTPSGPRWIELLYAEAKNAPKYVTNYFSSLKFTHTYSPSTYYDLTLGVQRGFTKSDLIRDRDLTKIKFIDDPLAGRIEMDEGPRGFYNSNSNVYDQIGNMLQSAKILWRNVHNTTINFKGNFVSQVNKYNQIKAGFEFNNFHINHRSFRSAQSTYTHNEEEEPINFAVYKADPREFEAYIQDKFEWEGMIMNFGLRASYYDPNTNAFNLTESNMFSDIWTASKQWGDEIDEGNWKFSEQRTREIKNKVLLQPRIGISHPITEQSKIFFNYGHFYQRPAYWNTYYVGYTTTVGSNTSTTGRIPVPDIPWPKTVSYEIGYSQSIYNQVLLQISGYYKDYTSEVTTISIKSWNEDVNYQTYANNHYRDIRGLEFRIERSFGRFVNFFANYNYMIASSGDTGLKAFYERPVEQQNLWNSFGQERAEVLPSFRSSITLRTPVDFGPGQRILGIKPLAEWRVNLISTWQDGGEFVDDDDIAPRYWNYIQVVNTHMHNLYIQKRIARGANFYIRIMNVFDIKRFNRGSGYQSSLRLPWTTPSGNDKYGDYDKYWINTHSAGDDWIKWDHNKRDIYFGIRYQF